MDYIKPSEVKGIEKVLKLSGKKFLLYHSDSDGVCSASLVMKFFQDFVCIPRKGPEMDSNIIDYIIKEKPDVLLFLDLPVDQEWNKIREIVMSLPKIRIVVIDHHIMERDLNSKSIVHINPRFRTRKYLPTTYLVYDILERLGLDVRRYMWIACIGIIGDYGFQDCKDIMGDCKRLHPDLMKGSPLKSKLGRASDMISSVITLKGLKGANEALKTMVKSEAFQDFFSNKRIREWDKVVREELKSVLKVSEKDREFHPELDLMIYTIKTKLSLVSTVSNILGEKFSENTVVIRKRVPDGWKVSFRNQSGRVNLGKIVKRAVTGFGSGGGHEKSAGAVVKDWEEFKTAFLRELRREL